MQTYTETRRTRATTHGLRQECGHSRNYFRKFCVVLSERDDFLLDRYIFTLILAEFKRTYKKNSPVAWQAICSNQVPQKGL